MSKGSKRKVAEPSESSLKEIPEVDFSNRRKRNPYAKRIAQEGIVVQVGRARPRRLLEVGGTEPRSVRFPRTVWKKLETQARRKGLTLHAALRQAILEWLRDAA
jgi:hypothetical protein